MMVFVCTVTQIYVPQSVKHIQNPLGAVYSSWQNELYCNTHPLPVSSTHLYGLLLFWPSAGILYSANFQKWIFLGCCSVNLQQSEQWPLECCGRTVHVQRTSLNFWQDTISKTLCDLAFTSCTSSQAMTALKHLPFCFKQLHWTHKKYILPVYN